MCITSIQNGNTPTGKVEDRLDPQTEKEIRKYVSALAEIQRRIVQGKKTPSDGDYLRHYAILCSEHFLAAIHMQGESPKFVDYLVKLTYDIAPDLLTDRIIGLARKKHTAWYHKNVSQ